MRAEAEDCKFFFSFAAKNGGFVSGISSAQAYSHKCISYCLQATFSVLVSLHDEVPIYKGCLAKKKIDTYGRMVFFSLPRIQHVWNTHPRGTGKDGMAMFMWVLIRNKIEEGVDARKVGCLSNMAANVQPHSVWAAMVPETYRIWVEVL